MYSEPYQTSKMEHFAKTVNGWKPLTIFPHCSALDLWQGSEHTSESKDKFFENNKT